MRSVKPTSPVDHRRRAPVAWRRAVFGTLVLSTTALILALMVWTLSDGGFDLIDGLILACFALTLPFTVVGFWNAVIGFVLARFCANPLAIAGPPGLRADDGAEASGQAIESRVALLVCVRNEDVDSVFTRLSAMLDELLRAGLAGNFVAAVLSDTDEADIAAAEEEAFERTRARYADRFDVRYRRRADNRAFKAGNIEDFASAHRDAFDLMLVLDADSYVSAAAIHRLVAAMEADPKLGILQSLVVGMPTVSPFARVFQFGMRFGMRLYTLGSAWWQADCGPYWGHNAVVRMQPFVDHCRLPKLEGDGPLAGWILSHDQVEAALMRRAGYDVRVVPVESESFEENPPSLIEFIRRELRWCHGNMQYLRLLATPGLAFLSRVQLLLAALMFIGSAAWMAMMIVIAVAVTASNGAVPVFHADVGLLLFLTILVMIFTPKLATTLAILTRSGERRRFGGLVRFLPGVVAEVVFSMLIAPVVAFSVFLFLVGLPFGRRMRWAAQQRGAALVPLAAAASRFWPHALFGAALLVGYASVSWNAVYFATPLLVGLLLAAPFTTLTSSAWLGRALARIGAFAIPEETEPPATLRPLALEALTTHHAGAAPAATTAAGTVAVADTPGS